MKRHTDLLVACTACGALLLAACSKDKPTVVPEPEQASPLSITVADIGYAPADGDKTFAPTPRAATNGYKTGFTEGDAVGLYIVRDGVVTAANVKLTAVAITGGDTSDTSGANLTWTTDEELSHFSGNSYYLYYPWQSSPQGAPASGASVESIRDTEFFADMITSWQPATDQSDYAAGYSASDLMTAAGKITSRQTDGRQIVGFAMEHRMALTVVELPKTIYKFTNVPAIPEYTVSIAKAAFDARVQPYLMKDGTYRYLTNPRTAEPRDLTGSYTGADGTIHDFGFTPCTATGKYEIRKIDGGYTEKSHALQTGDFFLSDGNLLPKEADTELVQAANVVGIVFQTDPARIGEAEKKALGGKAHGLVMALKNAAIDLTWGPSDMDEGLTKCETKVATYNDISGLHNCTHIRTNRDGFDAYPAFKAAEDYNATCPVSSVSTGWYLPAAGQWWDIFQHLGQVPAIADKSEQTSQTSGHIYYHEQGDFLATLHASMEKIADENKDAFESRFWIWTSSEYSSSEARNWDSLHDYYLGSGYHRKDETGYVRPVLAF